MRLHEGGWWYSKSWITWPRFRVVIYARTKDWPSVCFWMVPGTYED